MGRNKMTAAEYLAMVKSDPKPSKTKRKKKFSFYNTTAWRYLSKYIKLFYADDNYLVKCFTCGKQMHITDKKCHAGHLIKVRDSNSSNYSTAFQFENIGINCYQCNVYSGGKQDLMLNKLISLHGQEAIDKLYLKSNNACKLDNVSLKYWKEHYKEKLNNLIEIQGNPWK